MPMRKLVLSSLLIMLMLAAVPAVAQPWVLLGQRIVTDRLDHDSIAVTAARGDFSAIKLTVHRRPVDVHRVVVFFANGESQEIELRSTIPAGGESRVIDLRGGDRVIRSVELWYDARSLAGRRAVVRVFGRR